MVVGLLMHFYFCYELEFELEFELEVGFVVVVKGRDLRFYCCGQR